MKRASIKPLPSQERLKELFDYDQDSGSLIRRKFIERGPVGHVCGGHRSVYIGNTLYYAHRIIWKWMTGEEPTFQIDHIDVDGLNNNWRNLRKANNQKNRWNAKLRADNKSGFKGVYRRGPSYVASIRDVSGRLIHLGSFSTAEEASAVWVCAAASQRGEFLRLA